MALFEQIVAYIRQNKDAYPMDALREQLLRQGIPAETIEKAVHAAATGTGDGTGPAPGAGGTADGLRETRCTLHLHRPLAGRCAVCGKPFCSQCLADVRGRMHCNKCRLAAEAAGPEADNTSLAAGLAGEALTYAIIGIFCFGIFLEPIAISKALRARRLMEGRSGWPGSGKALAALVIAVITLILWVLGLIAKFVPV